MPQMTMVQAIQDALRLALREDPRVVVMGEDVGLNGGVFRVTEGLQAEFGSDRVADTPLAENGIVGAAIGNSIGSGDGRRAATVAGAIIGSAIGHDAGERRAARDGGDYDGNNYGTRDRGYNDSRSHPVENHRCATNRPFSHLPPGYESPPAYIPRPPPPSP